jgi:hypothetical protein
VSARLRRCADGQASVELVGMVPLVAAVVLAAAQFLAAGVTREYAGHAAEAGAVAMLQGGDPVEAARRALPGWSRGAMHVAVSGRAVRVRVRPVGLVPPLAARLESTATADAGPAS